MLEYRCMQYGSKDDTTFQLDDTSIIISVTGKDQVSHAYKDVKAVHLVRVEGSGAGRISGASLKGDIGGTATDIISAQNQNQSQLKAGTSAYYEVTLKAGGSDYCISYGADDDAVLFKAFVTELHKRLADSGTSIVYSKGSRFTFFAQMIALVAWIGVISYFVSFLMESAGYLMMIPVLIGVIGSGILIYLMRSSRPTSYDPLNIPSDLLP